MSRPAEVIITSPMSIAKGYGINTKLDIGVGILDFLSTYGAKQSNQVIHLQVLRRDTALTAIQGRSLLRYVESSPAPTL